MLNVYEVRILLGSNPAGWNRRTYSWLDANVAADLVKRETAAALKAGFTVTKEPLRGSRIAESQALIQLFVRNSSFGRAYWAPVETLEAVEVS